MNLTHQEVTLLQSYANLLLGPIQAQVTVSYDPATQELCVHCTSLPEEPDSIEARNYTKVAALTEAQTFIETVIDEFRCDFRNPQL